MAAVVDSLVSLTVEKIGELLIQEVCNLYGVRENVESIQRDLRWMQSFLKDADRKLGDGDERVKTMVADVWRVARKVEDIVDAFRLRDERRRRRGPFKKFVYCWSDFVSRKRIGEAIEGIKKETKSISGHKETYGVPKIHGGEGPSHMSSKLSDYRRSTALADGDEVVGFAADVKKLLERLIGGGADDSCRRRVVSIVAQGGAGKTTLANRVYKSDHVKNHFGDSTAWVCVSQTYKPIHLLQEIAGKVMGKQDKALKEKDLQEKLSEYLREKRYLIVLDDLWHTDAWDQLKAAFPDAKNGSRIILTTRNERVALYADPDPANPPYHLPLLNPDDSWKLFLKKAFPWQETGTEIPCSSSSEELMDTGKQIVEKCGGLPLAISVVGGFPEFKGEIKVKDWRNVLVRLKAKLSGESVHCSDIIALSYYDLPYHLKPCFLYLGLFPEDYEIDACKLKRLWIAEGFIQPEEGWEKEDLAEDYLIELIGRCLIRVDKKDWDGSVISCRIHDLLHDFAISEGKKYKFLEICSKASARASISTEACWLAIHPEAIVLSNSYSPNIRSVLSFKQYGEANLLHDLSGGLEQLQVLDFQLSGSWVQYRMHTSIGKLSHLRYLNLEGNGYQPLPPSIGNLYNLVTLLLPKYVRLPKEIWRLHRLKHLEALMCEFEGEPRVYKLKNLHTLKLGMGNWIEEEKIISSLDGLKILGIGLQDGSHLTEHLTEQLGSFICKLVDIESFELHKEGRSKCQGILNLERHLHLSVMFLGVSLEGLPKVPTTLTELVLSNSLINDDLMPTLEKLTNLRTLSLASHAYTGKKIITSAHGFPQLRCLLFNALYQLEEWVVEEGAMPKLEKLKIEACPKLNKLSEGLGCITTLKKLCILYPSVELQNWLNNQPSIARLVTMEDVWSSKWKPFLNSWLKLMVMLDFIG